MTSIRINVSTKAGDMEADADFPTTTSETGVGYIRQGIITAANRILRGYGQEEISE